MYNTVTWSFVVTYFYGYLLQFLHCAFWWHDCTVLGVPVY